MLSGREGTKLAHLVPLCTTPTLICRPDLKTSRSPIFTHAQGCVQFSETTTDSDDKDRKPLCFLHFKTGKLTFNIPRPTHWKRQWSLFFFLSVCSKHASVRNSRSYCTGFKIHTPRQTQKKKEKPCGTGVCRHKRWVLPDCLHWLVGNQSSGAWLTLKATHKYTHVCTKTHGIFIGLIRGNGRMFLRPHAHTNARAHAQVFNWVPAWTV